MDVVQQNVGQGRLAFRGVKRSQVNAGGSEGFVGWSEDRERSFALQGCHQLGLDKGSHQRGVNARAARRPCDVVVRIARRQHLVDDVDDAVAGVHVGRGHRGVVDHHGTVDREGERLAIDGVRRHAFRDRASGHFARNHVVEQDVTEGGLAFGGVEGSEVDASVRKGLVGRCKERERPIALEGFEQFGLNHGRHEAGMNSSALCRTGQIVRRVRWCQHLVDDVDDAVAGGHVGGGDVGAVDHHAVADGERQRLTIGRVSGHAFRDVGRGHAGADHVVEQDVRQRLLAFRRVKRSQIDASVCEGLVRRCKDREWTVALEGFKQFGLDDGGHETVVHRGALGRAWDVVGGGRRRQHLVDDVDDAVAGGHVCGGHGGAVDHHAISDGEAERVAVDGRGRHAVRDVGRRNVCANHVVEQDVRQRLLAFSRIKCSQIDASVCEGLVRRCKDRERTVALEGFEQFGLHHGGDQGRVAARARGRARNVVGRVRWGQHLVDDVDDAVAGVHVGDGDGRVVDHHATVDGESERLAVDSVR